MQTVLQKTNYHSYIRNETHVSSLKKFIDWAKKQEEDRFLWMAIAIGGHGCFFTIITLLMILFTGNHFIFWPFAIAAMAVPVVTNLAALPTKITIPIFFLSLLMDIVIIILCIGNGFDMSAGTP
jgi:hypothetical protein